MFKSKLFKTTTVSLLVLISQPFSNAEASGLLYHIGADFVPMVSLSWDKTMGLNFGIGASSGQDIFVGMVGPYVYTNFSLKKPGVSVSCGHYVTIAGMFSMRNGVTLMSVRDEKLGGTYLGVENSMTLSPMVTATHLAPLNLMGGYYRVSGLKRLGHNGLYANYALGIGMF